MFESPAEIERLQELLDASYAAAGSHMESIHSPRVRITAEELAERLAGMQVFVVATTTRDGRPRTGPVDTFLYHGDLCFGTAATALRARHIARNPAVSATHVQGEGLVVTVHGTARSLDLGGADRHFAEFLRGHYGEATFDEHLDAAPYYRIAAERMFAADMTRHLPAD